MWIFIIIIIVAVIVFFNYNTDKKVLHTKVEEKGGMDRIFLDFITCIENDFSKHKIIVNSNTELELSATTADNKTFYFGIKLGFGDKVNYRCDTKRSNFLNADILVEGNKLNQVAPYMMIIDELKKKYSLINNAELDNAELDNAELDNAELVQAELVQAELVQAELDNAELDNAELVQAELDNAELDNAELVQAELVQAQRFMDDYCSNSPTGSVADSVPKISNPIIYSHFNSVYKKIKALIVSNTKCTILMENLREYIFEVDSYYVSDDTGNLIKNPKEIDTTMFYMVTSIERSESPGFIHFTLKYNDNYNDYCDITFSFDNNPTMIEIRYENGMTLYYIKKNTN